VPLKQCSLCRCVSYCDRQCQKADWKEHKKKCTKEYELSYSGEIKDSCGNEANFSFTEIIGKRDRLQLAIGQNETLVLNTTKQNEFTQVYDRSKRNVKLYGKHF